MSLWTGAFGDVGWIFESLNAGTANRKLDHTRVAEEDGKIVSAVDVFLQPVRDESAQPVMMGGIGSVATLEAYRKQGLSGQLLLDAIELMRREDCSWSMLFTGYHGHYGKYGWELIDWRRRVGQGLRGASSKAEFEVECLENLGPWPIESLMTVYDAFNATRPLTHARTELYWRIAIRIRLERPGMRTFIARRGDGVSAYLVLKIKTDGHDPLKLDYLPEVSEVGCLPGAEEAVLDLLSAAIGDHQGPVSIRCPHDRAIDSALEAFFARVSEEKWFGPMVRGIHPDWTLDRIRAMTDLPQAHFWDLDKF